MHAHNTTLSQYIILITFLSILVCYITYILSFNNKVFYSDLNYNYTIKLHNNKNKVWRSVNIADEFYALILLH